MTCPKLNWLEVSRRWYDMKMHVLHCNCDQVLCCHFFFFLVLKEVRARITGFLKFCDAGERIKGKR